MVISQSALGSFALAVFAAALVVLTVSLFARRRLRAWSQNNSNKQIARLDDAATRALISIRDDISKHLGRGRLDSGVLATQYDPASILSLVNEYVRPIRLGAKVRRNYQRMLNILALVPYVLCLLLLVSLGTGIATLVRNLLGDVVLALAIVLVVITGIAAAMGVAFFLYAMVFDRADAYLDSTVEKEPE